MKSNSKNVLLVTLIVGIISMTVAYAALSTTLRISTGAKVAATKWDIHFENLTLVANASENTGEVVHPAQIQGNTTQISGLVVDLKKPGDKITYTFDIVNDSDIDAKLNSIVFATPNCGANSAECQKLEYSLKYTTGGQTPAVGNTLAKKTRVNVTLTIKYKDNNPLTEEDVTASGIDITMIYGQN